VLWVFFVLGEWGEYDWCVIFRDFDVVNDKKTKRRKKNDDDSKSRICFGFYCFFEEKFSSHN